MDEHLLFLLLVGDSLNSFLLFGSFVSSKHRHTKKCGGHLNKIKFSSLFFADCNGIYLLGKFNGVEFSRITKLNTAELRDTTVYSIYVSQKDEIFLISSSGDVYKSTSEADIRFERIILFNQNDNIRKFCSGYDFVCVLTGKCVLARLLLFYYLFLFKCTFYIPHARHPSACACAIELRV